MSVLLSAIGVFMCLMANPALAAMDLADEPMMSKTKAAPANIMIVLDDSGSMTFEVLVPGFYDGKFPNPDEGYEDGYSYIYDYLGDNAYTDPLRYMESEGRKYWKSQFFGENVMYYNPATTYEPWPDYSGQTFPPADTETPKPHPLKTGTTALDLDAESYSIVLEGDPNLAVKHAHYFVKDLSDAVWLVVIDGTATAIKYYRVTEFEGTGMAEKINKVREETPPSEIITGRTYQEERQNFANWFTYYRRREYVAKNAIARVIKDLKGVRVGILGINGKIIVPLKPLGIWKSGVYYDKRGELLQELYDYDSNGGTPLREGLNDIGKYYKDNSVWLKHYEGDKVEGVDPPYYSEADGGACQKSFTIVMTDGYYSRDINDLNVDNADANTGNVYDGGFYADALSETLADVAMYYYKNDLSATLPDRVYNPEHLNRSLLDTAPHQHMVTYGVAFGVTGNLNPEDYNDDPTSADFLKDDNGNYPNWPAGEGNPTEIPERSIDTIDDLYHATVNGRGDFLTAKDPEELASALVELINNILSRLGSASSVAINGDMHYGVIDDDVLLFQASYDTTDWSGDVIAYQLDTDTGKVIEQDPPLWSAAESLKEQYWKNLNDEKWKSRPVFSYDGNDGFSFDKDSIPDELKPVIGSDYADIIDYVRGDPEIAGYRTRNDLLGDIVHSSPVFENNIVYVGANDGMLHAFEITVTTVSNKKVVTGDEIFAYVPGLVYENLVHLTQPAFVHKYFVDLTPVIGKGYGLLGGSEVETILVGGLGKGGQGIFALDITDPNNMSAGDVLWEFPNNGTSQENKDYMGYSFSTPVVVQTNSTEPNESWVVIIANGYDSTSGKAVLFILNPITGEVIQDIPAHNTSIGPDNGLSSPIAVDVNSDRKVDFVYAGDLYGNMWKFDLTGDNSAQWTVAYKAGSDDQPLFQAKGPGGTIQPITSKPDVMFHPKMSDNPSRHGLMVLFGTGKFLGDSDFTDDRKQAVYGIWDYGDRALYRGSWGDYSNDGDLEYLGYFTNPHLSNQYSAVTLEEQNATTYTIQMRDENNILTDVDVRVMSENELTWSTVDDTDPPGLGGEPNLPDLSNSDSNPARNAGWFWNLPLTGERVISNVYLRSGRLIVICFTPNPDRCSDGGTSFLMEIDSGSGGNVGGTIFDITSDHKINDDDRVIVEYDGDGNPIKKPPSGLNFPGNIQPPAISILNDKIEVKYLSSSTGAVYIIREKAVKLGISYWKEMEQ